MHRANNFPNNVNGGGHKIKQQPLHLDKNGILIRHVKIFTAD